jgi:hypothetical protein
MSEEKFGRCENCTGEKLSSEKLNTLFIRSQEAVVNEWIRTNEMKGHTNGCVLTRMVATGIHPDIAVDFIQAKLKPRLLRPGETVN